MTYVKTFINSKETDIFMDKSDGQEYTKDQIEEGFQYEQIDDPSVTIKEYYEKLINYLKGFRKERKGKQMVIHGDF